MRRDDQFREVTLGLWKEYLVKRWYGLAPDLAHLWASPVGAEFTGNKMNLRAEIVSIGSGTVLPSLTDASNRLETDLFGGEESDAET